MHKGKYKAKEGRNAKGKEQRYGNPYDSKPDLGPHAKNELKPRDPVMDGAFDRDRGGFGRQGY